MSSRAMATGGYGGGRAEDVFRRVGLDLVRGVQLRQRLSILTWAISVNREATY